jgi:molecular chaperone GrpE
MSAKPDEKPEGKAADEVTVEVDDGEEVAGEVSVEQKLEERVSQLDSEKKDLYERLLRATADLDNYRKRARKELEDARVDARARVLRELLPVFDNLERGLEHAASGGEGATAGIVEGVRLVLRQLEQALEKVDVVAVDAAGQAFDPNLHEAMAQEESTEHPPGTVVRVLQRGYKVGERLLRPALVVVAKRPPDEPAGANGKGDADS